MLAPDVTGFRQPISVGSKAMGRLSARLLALLFSLAALVPAAAAQEIEFYEYPGIAPGTASVRFAGERPLFYGGLQEAMEVFTKKTGIPASAVAGGCAQGAEYLKAGKANVGGFCCPLEESEKKAWTSILVARDAIPVIVHKSNPVGNLTAEQVKSIWTGKIQNWKEVGGRDQPIVVVFRNHCKDREEEFRTMMLAGGGKFTQNLFPAKTVGEEMDRVSRSPAAIGSIVGSAIVDMTKVKVIRVNGILPTPESVANETYPFRRDLHLATAGKPEGALAQFIEFILSNEGQQILGKKLAPIRRPDG
ncbi:MAG: hypothetical protein A2V83_05685 [Nitrospirae bacterium RBG_16_64_22]|nr:MAG: hypothetical protein A2V83_05685 [Nitrospirae bacterium RBG_16_64_22]